ncbi:hypothetical protein AB0M43_15695 [Longispora sp. NPDC051575]|uniref:hypothetical protein n=1 Tax=Longispora sp. NPDC051575 TaxID=3154943 RepID=UPI0034178770
MSITFTVAYFDDAPEINMNSANTAALLRLLGLPVESEGEVAAADMIGRVLLAQGLLDLATCDAYGLPDITDGRWTNCGRPRLPGRPARRVPPAGHLGARAPRDRHVVVGQGRGRQTSPARPRSRVTHRSLDRAPTTKERPCRT